MKTVTIQGDDYAVYADIDDGDRYYNADVSAFAVAWRAADDDDKARGLVTGTRFIDAANWKGEKTGGAGQANAFPRTGLVYPDGSPVDPATIPERVEIASIMLAGWFMEGTAAQNAANVASGTKRLKAGSVEIEYFGGIGRANDGGVQYPDFFLSLLGFWLYGTAQAAGAKAFGVCRPSATRRKFGVSYPF